MIRPIRNSKRTWFLYWVDLEEPVPGTGDDYFLPTLLIVCDESGAPLAAPEILEELDQIRVENFLTTLFEKLGAPERLAVCQSEDWDEEGWKAFSEENRLDVRFQNFDPEAPGALRSLARTVVMRFSRNDDHPPDPARVAAGLAANALRVRSTSKKNALLKAALLKDPECSAARIEIADLDFQNGNWKNCLAAYETIIAREGTRWFEVKPAWWTDRPTRPYLRAHYGRAMTLWHQGRYASAADQFENLLGINPTDNQGVRFFIPLLRLLSDESEAALTFYNEYAKSYPDDYIEPSFSFGWALTLSLFGYETEAKEKYRAGILKNIYIAPMLLEVNEPQRAIWHPNDRAEPNYAAEFIDSYAVLWDREPAALRLLRESWQDLKPRIQEILQLRETMADFQDQRYQPDYKSVWKNLLEKDESLTI